MPQAKTTLPALLNRARDKATPGPPRRVPPQHAGLELEGPELADVAAMIGLGVVAKELGKRHELVKTRAKAALFRAFTAEFWRRKKKPENPRIVIPDYDGEPDHDSLYQFRDQFTLTSFPDAAAIVEALAAPPPAGVKRAPAEAPLTHAQAMKVVHEEVGSSPALRLRFTLTELAEGHTEDDESGQARFTPATKQEKAIAEKLLAFLLAEPRAAGGKVPVAPLTEEERAHLLILDPRLQLRDAKGFMGRAVKYVSTLAQLRRLLATFRPIQIFSSSHFALAATERERSARLVLVAAEVLDGSSPPGSGITTPTRRASEGPIHAPERLD